MSLNSHPPSGFEASANANVDTKARPSATQAVSIRPALLPGVWLGLLGGGQLGRMFCFAAQTLGYHVMVIDPDPQNPAAATADAYLCAAYDDPNALQQLAQRCAAVTTEFENVPAPSLAWLAQHCVVAPQANAVAIAQDRIAEKRFIESCGLAVAPYAVIASAEQLAGISTHLLPGILKVARLGYDGKGQARVSDATQLAGAFAQLGSAPCVLEQLLDLAFEISVVIARGSDGAHQTFPVGENVHHHGILARSTVPSSQADLALQQQAQQAATAIAQQLNYVGVLCVEFFVLKNGQLLVNEIAPRPHNSGHYTLDACITSQFEQQVRTLVGLPLGDASAHSAAVMLNLLGDVWLNPRPGITSPQTPEPHPELSGDPALDDLHPHEPNWSEVLKLPGAKLHLYGKAPPRPGRKMGHITCIASERGDAQQQADVITRLLALPR